MANTPALIAPFLHPYFTVTGLGSRVCSHCGLTQSRRTCPACELPYCPVGKEARQQCSDKAGDCALCCYALPSTSESRDTCVREHDAGCMPCRDNKPLVVCDECAWTTCAQCAQLADLTAYHTQSCNDRSAKNVRETIVSLLQSNDTAHVALRVQAEIVRRYALALKPNVDWARIRSLGMATPPLEMLKELRDNVPSYSTRGAGMAEIVLLMLLYYFAPEEIDDSGATRREMLMQALYVMHHLKGYIAKQRSIVASMPSQVTVVKSVADACTVLDMDIVGSPKPGYAMRVRSGVPDVLPSSMWAREMTLPAEGGPAANVIYLINLVNLSAVENDVITHRIDPKSSGDWASLSPAVQEERTKAWKDACYKATPLSSHQLLLRLVCTPTMTRAQLMQAHSNLYSLEDWIAGKIPDATACGEWRNPLASRESILMLAQLIEMMADPAVDNTARRFLYQRLTGIHMPRTLEPCRIVMLRLNLNV